MASIVYHLGGSSIMAHKAYSLRVSILSEEGNGAVKVLAMDYASINIDAVSHDDAAKYDCMPTFIVNESELHEREIDAVRASATHLNEAAAIADRQAKKAMRVKDDVYDYLAELVGGGG